MDVLQFAIPTIVGILGLLAGRAWERYDRKLKKDQAILSKLLEILPRDSGAVSFLQNHDFGTTFQRRYIVILETLNNELGRPDCFFLNKKLENLKQNLFRELVNFLNLSAVEVFSNRNDPDFLELPNPEEIIRERIENKRFSKTEFDAAKIRADVTQHFDETAEQLNQIATNIYKSYFSLLKSAHEII